MTNSQRDLEAVTRETAAKLTSDSWEKMRSVSFGGAGVCTALILFVLQDPYLRQHLSAALIFASAGLPLLVASAFMIENYVAHGEASYKSLSRPSTFLVMAAAFFIGGLCLVVGIFALIRHFFPLIAWLFLAMSAIAFFLIMWHQSATKPGA